MISDIKKKLYSSEDFKKLGKAPDHKSVFLSGVTGSLGSFIIEYLHNKVNPKILFLTPDKSLPEAVRDDLSILSSSPNVSIYSPGSSSYDEELSKTLTDLSEDVSYIVLSNTRDFTDKIISKEVFKESVMEMKEGEELSFEEFL